MPKVSDPGPLDPDDPGRNPFFGTPFLGDLAKLLQQQGGMGLQAARQFAVGVATGGNAESNVDPLVRINLEQLARVAELRVADATGLTTSLTGRGITVLPVNRGTWAQRTIDAYQPLFEALADALGRPPIADTPEAGDADATETWLKGMMQAIAPMMLGMTSGAMVGHLAQRALGQYDLPIPRPASDELLLCEANVAAFAAEWSLPAEDVRLWVCLHDVTHHAVLGVPHVRARLEALLHQYVGGFSSSPDGLDERLGSIDFTNVSSMESIQEAMGDPETLLGAIQSPEQLQMQPLLAALVSVIAGYVDHVMDTVGGALITSYPMLTEALRRRRVTADASSKFVERLLGLEMTPAQYERGAVFIAGVLERAGTDGLERLWRSERELPTPNEVDAPGLWLARIDIPEA
jgi:putative hydrolase